MKTHLDCIPCFFKQALEATRAAGGDETAQKKILDEISRIIPEFPLESSPPEMATIVYRLVREITGITDPFKEVKEKSNRLALDIYPELKRKVALSEDKLLTALHLAIAGNIIDYGVKNSLDVEHEIEKCLNEDFNINSVSDEDIFDYQEFKDAFSKAKSIVYIADNAGEVVFDRVLIEELNNNSSDKEIIYAVRGKPVINDALYEDACQCGVDKIVRVISSGMDAPGTIIKSCSDEFIKLYENASMIISKGQGNFETLSGEDKPIFFLFKVKCPIVAKEVGCELGSVILKSKLKHDNIRKG